MSETTLIWNKTKKERATIFDQAFANIAPAERNEKNLRQKLTTLRALIAKKRDDGYSVDQICTAMKHPAIGLDVSPGYIRSVLRDAARRTEQRRKARLAALVPKSMRTPGGPTAAPRPAAKPGSTGPSTPVPAA